MKINLSYTKKMLLSNTIKISAYLILLLVIGFICLKVGITNAIKDGIWNNPIIWFGIFMFILGMAYTKLLEVFLGWQNRFQR